MSQRLYRSCTLSAGRRGLQVAFWILVGCNGRLGVSNEPGLGQDVGKDDDPTSPVSHENNPVSTGEHADAGPNLEPDAGVVSGSHCQSGTKDADEGDIDCGGRDCAACVTGACLRHADCVSGQCLAGLCAGVSCDDGVQNGDETGVDCGGASCRHCRSSTCNCATSDGLQPLNCDETDGYLALCGAELATTPDGSVATFTLCFLDTGSTTTTSHARAFRWTNGGGSEVVSDYATFLGLSSDGANALVRGDTEDSLRVVAAGVATPVPLPLDSVLSADGSSVAGVTRDDAGSYHLARWTRAGGLVTLADLPDAANNWTVQAVTADGSTVVGAGYRNAGTLPFRWNASSGLQDLGTLPSNATGALPARVSSDGSVIAGYTTGPSGEVEIFRWTQADALQTIRTATTAFSPGSWPILLSTDGSVVAGTGTLGEHSISAFRWDISDGVRLLGPGSEASFLVDMSSDGTIALGDVVGGGGAFLWRAQGTTSMASELAASGTDLSGWDELAPRRLSGDGKVVYGTGTCGGVPTYFRWALPQ